MAQTYCPACGYRLDCPPVKDTGCSFLGTQLVHNYCLEHNEEEITLAHRERLNELDVQMAAVREHFGVT